jgi:low affinity Fe/Cu permease
MMEVPLGKRSASTRRMLFLVVLCIVLWALGLMTSYTLGGLLHILLVIAIILFLVHVIQGRPIAD